ncbi:MAG TPA: MerR family transcriptional regulator [Methylocella sp.]|nr:MerR family transcriptional regulator [Methylocella sp.]
METNTQHESGRWLHHGASDGPDDEKLREARNDGHPQPEETLQLYSIREMARDFQVTSRALRFYEDRGLLRPRREGTNRPYDARDRLHLKMILKGKSLGFTLSEIADILSCRKEESGSTELERDLLPEQIAAQIDFLERQRSQIDEAIKTLRKAYRRPAETPPRNPGPDDQSRE